MIRKQVQLADASTVVLADEPQAQSVAAALRLLGLALDDFELRLAPDLFDNRLSRRLREGRTPTETSWTPTTLDAGS